MMFADARRLDDGTRLEADIAIVGAGPAGITIARAFAGSRFRIALVESGGLEFDPEVQDLHAGASTGIQYPVAGSRLRYFGGSSNHWGGYCRPLDPIDFEAREWVPHSGWPFGRDVLDPYYGRASEAVEVAPGRYEDDGYWRERTGEPLVAWPAGCVHARFFHYSPPTRFGERYRAALERASNVQVLLNASVRRLGAVPSGAAVDRLEVRTLTGRRHEVRARQYVLAAGGLENPRILLLSDDVVPRGLGNRNDQVGRYFMEHPHVGGFAEIVVADLARLPRIYRERLVFDGRAGKAAFVPAPGFLRRERLLNASFTMAVAGEYGSGTDLKEPMAQEHVAMLRSARSFLADGSRSLKTGDPGYAGVWMGIGCACEQVPNPESRVTLAAERDALGMRRINLDWRLTEQDRRSLDAHIRSLGREFAAAGIGRMRLRIEEDGRWPDVVAGGNHHMGTTRMNDEPRHGVVDRNCRVHGVDNLYVAGSSVFPTSGSANPTLNILALAYRLVDHLKERLA
jgi:choline dehydrogenase-like flavoprotein